MCMPLRTSCSACSVSLAAAAHRACKLAVCILRPYREIDVSQHIPGTLAVEQLRMKEAIARKAVLMCWNRHGSQLWMRCMRLAGTSIYSCGTAAAPRTQLTSLRGKCPLMLVKLTKKVRSLKSGTETRTPAQGGSAVCFRHTHWPRLEGVLVCAWLPVSSSCHLAPGAPCLQARHHVIALAPLGCKVGTYRRSMPHHQRPVVHAQVFTPSGKQEAYVAPQAIDQQKIAEVVQQFADGARNAIAAGALALCLRALHMKRVRCSRHFAEDVRTCSQRKFSTCQSAGNGV